MGIHQLWTDSEGLLLALEAGDEIGLENVMALAAQPICTKTIVHPRTLDHYFLLGFDRAPPLILRQSLKAIWRTRAEAYLQLAKIAN